MKIKSSIKDIYAIIAFVISGAVCVGIIFLLWQKNETTENFESQLNSLIILFVCISGFLSSIFMFFILKLVIGMKTNNNKAVGQLGKITQKMHSFRAIADLLINSNIWLPGLRDHFISQYPSLNYFEVKEFYKGKSEMAIDFLQENHHFGDTESLYLELRSLLMTHPKQKTIPENIEYPAFYNPDLVDKWAMHKVGNGLWYVFGYKFAIYKDSINLDAVFERHQEKILALANSIDNEAFEDSSFNEVFFAKLWEYMVKNIIPRLHQFKGQMVKKIPSVARYLYGAFLVLVVFGVLLPLCHLLISFAPIIIISGYAIVLSTIFYVAITFQFFISKELTH